MGILLLAVATREGLGALSERHAWAVVALLASYVAATSVNDIADVALDRVNLRGHRGRPLVDGSASPRALAALHVSAGALALACGALAASWAGALVVGGALALDLLYSLPPARLSYRTHAAHASLAVGYVFVPYALGLAVVGAWPTPLDAALAGALFLLMFGRLLLKDLRDREGDALGGKATFLLRHGKAATCATSAAAALAGNALLIAALGSAPWWLVLPLEALLACALVALWRVWRANEPAAEQAAIGLGARVGNGALLCALALVALRHEHATPVAQLVALWLLAGVFLANFATLVARQARVEAAPAS